MPGGDSVSFTLLLDSLESGWYYLGKTPNQLSQILLRQGEATVGRGTLARNGIILATPSAQVEWVKAEQAYFRLMQAMEAPKKMALVSLNDGNPAAYADYADIVRQAFAKVSHWLDSLEKVDPFLATEFSLKLEPPYLPFENEYSDEGAFAFQNRYWQGALANAGESAAIYPGLVTGFQSWMEMQHRDAIWSSPETRVERIDALLSQSKEGTALHKELLAATLSVFDEWGDTSFVKYGRDYLRLYGGNRRMQGFLEGRIKLFEERIRDQAQEPRLYGE